MVEKWNSRLSNQNQVYHIRATLQEVSLETQPN